MSSFSTLLQNYSLSQSLQVHSSTVRCLSLSEDMMLTGSYDTTLFLARYTENKYEPISTYSHHSALVYSCIFSPDNQSFFSGDKSGVIFHANLDGTKRVLGQHDDTVCSLDLNSNVLISGSWDASGKLWDVNTGICTTVLGKDKHAHGVIVKSTPFGILSGSQNGILNFWTQEGSFIRSLKVHDDMIRKIAYSEEIGIITCSNDGTIKIITPDGRIINTLIGHSGYVLTCGFIGLDIISGGDDKTLKVWKQSDCVDSILHPGTVWDIGVNYLGDIITTGSDCFTRVFTVDKARVADNEEISKFQSACVEVENNNNEIDLSKYPSVSEVQSKRGKNEGDIQVFRNGSIGEAFMWHEDGSYWEKIGEVVGSNPGTTNNSKFYEGDRFFPAKEYEYIFDVELGDGINRKLPFNNSDNPLESAEKFLTREGLGKAYVQEIVMFLNKNAKPNSIASAPKPQQVTSKYFPQVNFLDFPTGNLQTITNKIKEFNSLLETPHKLEELELRNLDRLSGVLSQKNFNNASLTVKDLELIKKILQWPKASIFPCLDLYRIVLLNHSAQEIFKTSDHGGEHIAHIAGLVSLSQENPILITGLKVLCNMFYGNSSQYSIETRREFVLNAALTHVENPNKNVRLGLISLLFNFSVKLVNKEEFSGKIQILSALNEILQNETDPDNLFRAFATIGNVVSGAGGRKEIIETANDLGIGEIIKKIKCTDKANECRLELVKLLQ